MTSLRSGPTLMLVSLARRGKSEAMGRVLMGLAHLEPISVVRVSMEGRPLPGVAVLRVGRRWLEDVRAGGTVALDAGEDDEGEVEDGETVVVRE